MANATFMNVFNARHQLLVHPHSCLFMQPLVRHNVVKQLSVLAELHDQEQFTFGFNDFIQLNHIRVSHLLQDLNFSADSLDVLLVFDSGLFKYFDGDL